MKKKACILLQAPHEKQYLIILLSAWDRSRDSTAKRNTTNPFPVITTGNSLCSNSHRKFLVMNTGSLQREQGFPVMKTGFSLWEFTTQRKPCSGPVRDCSADYNMCLMASYRSLIVMCGWLSVAHKVFPWSIALKNFNWVAAMSSEPKFLILT